jgi:hypothetical protein
MKTFQRKVVVIWYVLELNKIRDSLEITQSGWNSEIFLLPSKYPKSNPIPTSPDM